METLTQIPDEIDAGTSVEYTRSYGNYPASDGWTLKLILQGPSKLVKAATTNADGRSFDVALTAAETAALIAGSYSWTEKATNASLVRTKTAGSGRLEILPDVEAAAAGSLQLWEEVALAAVEKVIAWMNAGSPAGRLAADILEYEIAGRKVVKHDLDELLSIRDDMKARIRARRRPGRLCTPVRTTFPGQIRP